MNNRQRTDYLGIISIVLAGIGMAPIGLILGLIGASLAKKEHRSIALSRFGWIVNASILALGILWIVSVLITGKYKAG